MDTKKLSRILSVPTGSEATCLQAVYNLMDSTAAGCENNEWPHDDHVRRVGAF
ncbi:hypothetical protein M5X11_12690 [Paenibacillus alginolyticus]|uniref:hypothetical protein n=1 Tax=Paenibacillus alginolyticus TaxID=59839 RepID=UPI0003FF3D79|nr:hypothetical protein [Paenibacillus alginolyticus]MCY9665813.1 hypothetical protein [Paenibacillus alginolyticus]